MAHPHSRTSLNWPAAGRATVLIAVAGSLPEAEAAARAGADLVDLGTAGTDVTRAVRARLPGVGVCAAEPPADVVADVAAARARGAMVICDSVEAARSAGLPPGRVLVQVPPRLVPQARREGFATVVDADHAAARAEGARADRASADRDRDDTGDSAVLAIAAISSWLGATAVRTRHVGQVRRALDMTASIRGLRPPARAVRGLG